MYINIPFSKTFLTPLPNIIPPYLPSSREASSMVAHACLLEGGFRIEVQCIKNKIKSKLKSGGAGGNWVNRKYLFIKASLQANQVFLHPQRPTLTLVYFLVTLLSASPQETKALSGGHNT